MDKPEDSEEQGWKRCGKTGERSYPSQQGGGGSRDAELPHLIQALGLRCLQVTGISPVWTVQGRVYSMTLVKGSRVLRYTLYLPVNGLRKEFYQLTIDGKEVEVGTVAEAMREFAGKTGKSRLPASVPVRTPQQLRKGVIMRN
ncbi:hypothetical protein ACIBI7_51860 [Nonomuraea fuscirosea]|uniref:hypothetical protein n=1 Tax=Nonomuraea fuscirosea TaxID=1291556 RepID=UPI0037B734C9